VIQYDDEQKNDGSLINKTGTNSKPTLNMAMLKNASRAFNASALGLKLHNSEEILRGCEFYEVPR
jgi:hypothetical protein